MSQVDESAIERVLSVLAAEGAQLATPAAQEAWARKLIAAAAAPEGETGDGARLRAERDIYFQVLCDIQSGHGGATEIIELIDAADAEVAALAAPCPGIEVEPGVYSGCTAHLTGATDCPVCGGGMTAVRERVEALLPLPDDLTDYGKGYQDAINEALTRIDSELAGAPEALSADEFARQATSFGMTPDGAPEAPSDWRGKTLYEAVEALQEPTADEMRAAVLDLLDRTNLAGASPCVCAAGTPDGEAGEGAPLPIPAPGEMVNVAYCPDHGLHGCRLACFECGKPVVQVPMTTVAATASGHRLRFEFDADDVPRVCLICPPGNQGCIPPVCEHGEMTGCCEPSTEPCWAATWDDEDHHITGVVEVPVDLRAEDNESSPIYTIRPAASGETGDDERDCPASTPCACGHTRGAHILKSPQPDYCCTDAPMGTCPCPGFTPASESPTGGDA